MNEDVLRSFPEQMRERVIGQAPAIAKIKDVLASTRNSRSPARPMATLLFVGGVGTGLNRTAVTIAEVLFGDKEAYKWIRVCDGVEAQIVKALSTRACVSVVRDIADDANERMRSDLALLLQRFRDDFPSLDEDGRAVDVGKSIFVVSIHADLPAELEIPAGTVSEEPLRLWLERRFRDKFTASFFQSFDAIVPFKRFDVAAKIRMAERKIGELIKRQASSGQTMLVDNSVAAYVGSRARDELGAFDVQRALDDYVGIPFSDAVSNSQSDGKVASTIRISVVGDKIRINVD